MQELLTHPAMQAAVVPAIVAAIAATLFVKIRADFSALSLLAGFLATCVLVTDLSFQPLTSTKKIIILTIFAAILGMALQFLPKKKPLLLILIAVSSLIACAWLLWPVLSRKELLEAISLLLPFAFYSFSVIAIVASSVASSARNITESAINNRVINNRAINNRAIDLSLIAIIFAATTSVACVIGASALYGQMAASLAASATSLLLISLLLGNKHQADEFFAILLFLPISLIAIAASIYAKLPWYVLPCLAVIPALILINISDSYQLWKRLVIRVGLATLPGGLALYLTLDAAGPVPY